MNFDSIRPYLDSEVNEALQALKHHPVIKALFHFALPKANPDTIHQLLNRCHSIQDFQTKIVYHAVLTILDKSSNGFSKSGFEKLQPNTSYLFISNHRDIILDTSLLNLALFENNLVMTASAIGDNLVQKPFLLALSKLNRNFLIKRGLSPRDALQSAKEASSYINTLLLNENRSVWIAQREGRTKDGNDETQQGVLKMLALGSGEEQVMRYFKKLKIVPVAISYEFDPTDILKIPELMAKHHDIAYKKTNNEDFNSILKGAMGQKGRIHISVCEPLRQELEAIEASKEPLNKQFQMLGEVIDKKIHQNYKLWPSNYIAYDLLHHTHTFLNTYTPKEKRQFKRRIERRVDAANDVALRNFLAMYANPVINSMNYKKKLF